MAALQYVTFEEFAASPARLSVVPAPAPAECVRSVPVPAVAVRHTEAVYRRRRFMVAAAAAAVITVLLAVARPDAAPSNGLPADGSTDSVAVDFDASSIYVVAPGDTLWDIARALAPGTDPRLVVHELAKAAGGADLQPGQRITIGSWKA